MHSWHETIFLHNLYDGTARFYIEVCQNGGHENFINLPVLYPNRTLIMQQVSIRTGPTWTIVHSRIAAD